ncbi:unnamed protein product [Ranitomeya imitator]|uniref:Uncharacterized protein n=1 Tax=Ranitomeya imitator TaxID=111125 RepID=A0ABN9LJ78_9NEOB|nr:unnamed protein product [Ranitomeya imitator]
MERSLRYTRPTSSSEACARRHGDRGRTHSFGRDDIALNVRVPAVRLLLRRGRGFLAGVLSTACSAALSPGMGGDRVLRAGLRLEWPERT